MRRSLRVEFLFVALAFGLLPSAAIGADWRLSAGAGAGVPFGGSPVQEGLGTGVTTAAALACDLPQGFEIAARFHYGRFSRDDSGVLRQSSIEQRPWRILDISGGGATWIGGNLQVRFDPSGSMQAALHPFVTVGAGMASLEVETATFHYAYAGHTWVGEVPGSKGTHPEMGIGVGLRYGLSRRSALACEGRYDAVFLREADFRCLSLRLDVVFRL